MTFDEILESNERGKGMVISDDGNIYCNSGLVCQDLTQSCSMSYKFDSSGNLVWKTLIDDINSLNWETIQIENDSVYVGLANFTSNPNDNLSQAILNDETGEEIKFFDSEYYNPQSVTLAPFGQIIISDKIYVYGGGWNHLENFNSPGYIHIMDKQGNYLDHLEYRQDNFNGIFQLMDGPGDDLYFLCER